MQDFSAASASAQVAQRERRMRRVERDDGGKLADAMAEAILSGEFAPGSRLDEQHLAQRYSVSRTPVREALRQLATTGLIEMRPRRTPVGASVTPGQLEEMFVAMGEVEAACAAREGGL